MFKIAVLAGDLRQHHITDFLSHKGYNAEYIYDIEPKDFNVFIVPVPFSRDNVTVNAMLKNNLTIDNFGHLLKKGQFVIGGNLPKAFLSLMKKKGVICHDFMKDEELVWQNALLTAEGLLSKIIDSTPFSIMHSKALVIGYGKCGTLTADKLNALGADVYIHDHTPKHLWQVQADGYIPVTFDELPNILKHIDILINTVPAVVLTENHISTLKKRCVLFEIASHPGGFEKEMINKHNLSLITCPGLPGKTAPETAGEIISKNITEYLERVDFNEP